MPYIKPEDRDYVKREGPEGPGDLNYSLTHQVDNYLTYHADGFGYKAINEVIGVLECMKLELYRRIAAPYEDAKMEENGDVYTVKENL